MRRFIDISASSLALFTALALTACEQSDAPQKPVPGIDRTVAGTWFEGEWTNTQTEAGALPAFRLSSDKLQWGDCVADIQSLVSHDEMKAVLVVRKGSACPASSQELLRDITLQRKSDCEMGVELYVSAEALRRSAPKESAVYTKVNCNQPSSK